MRMQTDTYPVFKYDELSDSAKEKAREWYCEDLPWDPEYVIEDAATIADLFGLDIRQTRKTLMGGGHRYDPTVYWSGFWSQGDGACYEGTYKYKTNSVKMVKACCGDAEVIRIVESLAKVQRKFFYHLTAVCKHRGHYYHSGCMEVSVDIDSDADYSDSKLWRDAEDDVIQLLRDFADWIYRRLEEEYEYQTSEEAVAESMEANEYEFYEDGSIA